MHGEVERGSVVYSDADEIERSAHDVRGGGYCVEVLGGSPDVKNR
jgi:hypothetical protein